MNKPKFNVAYGDDLWPTHRAAVTIAQHMARRNNARYVVRKGHTGSWRVQRDRP